MLYGRCEYFKCTIIMDKYLVQTWQLEFDLVTFGVSHMMAR